MNAPDPKANTTTEAYLAYKAGYLEESELKPKLYEPYLHFDAWLAYWAGLTNEYPLDKNGDPEMLTDEEALVAYLSGVTDTYPEDIKDPYDVRIVGYLKHLASIRWPEPDYPVNNEEFYLSTMEPTHTSNSEPSADIELDTAEGKIISVEAYGDTFQQTYSGKNICKSLASAKTQNGVTMTKNADGTYTATGTPTGVAFILPQTQQQSDIFPAGTYTFSLSSSQVYRYVVEWYSPSDSSTRIGIFDSQYSSDAHAPHTLTTTEPFCFRISLVFVNGAGQAINYTCGFQIEEGSTATSYEPYVGGIPAPNPDYPQAVQTVTGEQTVEVTGKNLFPTVSQASSSTGITIAHNSDGTYNISGTATSEFNAIIWVEDLSAFADGQTYTLSVSEQVGDLLVLVDMYNGSTWLRSFPRPGGTTLSRTAALDLTNATKIKFSLQVQRGKTVNLTNLAVQFEKGTATDYQPYQSQSYPISLGSIELCKIGDYQDYIYESGDDWYVHKATARVDVSSLGGWFASGSYAYKTRNGMSDILPASRDSATAVGLCNAFSASTTNLVYAGSVDYGFALPGAGGTGILIRNKNVTSLADFTTYLSNNPVYGYFALATPTDTQITDATLIGQLNALAGADTYNKKTYIKVTATDPNLPALLKVEAYKY